VARPNRSATPPISAGIEDTRLEIRPVVGIKRFSSAMTLGQPVSEGDQSHPIDEEIENFSSSSKSQRRASSNSQLAPHEKLSKIFSLSNNFGSTTTVNDDIELGVVRSSSGSKQVRTRKSEVLDREISLSRPHTQRHRSFSFSIGPHLKAFGEGKKKGENEKRQSHDWSFASYSFNLSNEAKDLKRPDILDVIHFAHYANMAYVSLDNEIQKKTDLLLHFSPSNYLFQAPYMVSIDHDWNSIVIAIRGTYSTADILVDLSIDTHILDDDLPQAQDYKVHAGFYQTALNIFNDIASSQVLEKAKLHSPRVADYHIVV
jgi:hypothetical protein